MRTVVVNTHRIVIVVFRFFRLTLDWDGDGGGIASGEYWLV